MDAIVENDIVIIEWITLQDKVCLKFTYSDILTEYEAEQISKDWLRNFDDNGQTKFNLVFDCKSQENYQTILKYFWNLLLVKLKNRIDQIWVLIE